LVIDKPGSEKLLRNGMRWNCDRED
jgi:hypothetical protein